MDVICVLCFEPLRDARVLSCGHKCCAECVRRKQEIYRTDFTLCGRKEDKLNGMKDMPILCGECGARSATAVSDNGKSAKEIERLKEEFRNRKCMGKKWDQRAMFMCELCKQKQVPFLFCERHCSIHNEYFDHVAEEIKIGNLIYVVIDKTMCREHRLKIL